MGDFIGSSSDRLLGRTGMSPTDMLIREMAQNAWDARKEGEQPLFELHLRTLHGSAADALRNLLGQAQGLGLEELGTDDIDVLEVVDRGTVGLDGPIDLRPASEGESSNYQDLILKLGVPRDDGGGGGTFGFGKTAAYAYSAHGTVIYWTRCLHEGELQERFIGSAMGEPFTEGEQQFTGRHWWGWDEDGLAIPLIDADAAAWGARLFGKAFEGEETGTSILIVAPLTDQTVGDHNAPEDPEEQAVRPAFADAARSAIRRNLWPKLTPPAAGGNAPMRMSLSVYGQEVDLGNPASGAWKHWAAALNAIRSQRSGEELPADARPRIDLMPVTWWKKHVGDIALLRRPRLLEEIDPDDDMDPVNKGALMDRLALMRGRAELVLRTMDVRTSETGDLYDWIAVFKSADEWEKTFAAAEPPAHDDWQSDGHDSTVDSVVRTVRRKVPAQLRTALETSERISDGGEQSAALDMSRRLAGLLPVPTHNSPEHVPGTAKDRSAKGKVIILRHTHLPVRHPDQQEQLVELVVESSDEVCLLRLTASLSSDDRANDRETWSTAFQPAWRGVEEVRDDGHVVLVRPGRQMTLTLSGPRRRALDIELTLERSPDSPGTDEADDG